MTVTAAKVENPPTAWEPLTAARDAAKILSESTSQVDDEATFPTQGMQALREQGLMGLVVPPEYGGPGASFETMSEVAQVLAGACLSTSMIWAMHCQQVATLVDHGRESLRQRVLPRIAAGQMFVASVTSERNKGGDLMTALAPLRREGDDLLLVRDAPVVTGGGQGDGYLISMRVSEQSAPSDVVLVFAERAQLEVQLLSGWSTMGMRGTSSIGMKLNGRLPEDQLVDAGGSFSELATSTVIPVGHIAWASCWLGAARGAFRRLIQLLRDPAERRGHDIQSDLFAERLARIRLQLESAGAYLKLVVREYEQLRAKGLAKNPAFRAPWFNIHINNVKLLASELLFDAVDRMIQLAGLRHGYFKGQELGLERVFRDLRSASLMFANDRLLVANGKLALLDRDVILPS